MLKFPQFPIRSGQHIVPPHAKYVVISTIIIFALFSSHIPAFSILYAKSNYRDSKKIVAPKKIETIVVTKAPIKEAQVSKRASANASHITNKNVPLPTKNPDGEKKVVQPPKHDVMIAANTPTSIATPQPKPERQGDIAQIQSTSAPNDAKGALFAALNAYRQKKGKSSLSWNDTLAGFAQGRAEQFDREGKMDNHAGFHDLTNNDGFNRMGFLSLAENSSYGDTRDPVFIIENLYGQSPGHDANQLSGDYTHVGIGASGKATDLLFGGKKK